MNRRIRGPGGNKGDTALKLLERLGRKTEQGKPEVRENPIFAGRAADAREEEYQNLKVTVHRAIVDEMSAEQQRVLDSATHSRQEIENVISGYVQRVLEHNPFVVPRGERARLVSDICDEILGLGPIEPFLKDDSITEVMVNGPKKILCGTDGETPPYGSPVPRQQSSDGHHRQDRHPHRPACG